VKCNCDQKVIVYLFEGIGFDKVSVLNYTDFFFLFLFILEILYYIKGKFQVYLEMNLDYFLLILKANLNKNFKFCEI
jgi:hypothetical protein